MHTHSKRRPASRQSHEQEAQNTHAFAEKTPYKDINDLYINVKIITINVEIAVGRRNRCTAGRHFAGGQFLLAPFSPVYSR